MAIRTLIVDDHVVVRVGLRTFLSRDPEIEIVDEAANGTEAIEKARLLHPDVVLIDLLLPEIDGITAIRTIRREMPETEVVALTSVLEPGSVADAIRAGAIGYLLKDVQAVDLRAAIKKAAMGQVHLDSQALAILFKEIRVSDDILMPLTKREEDVLRQLARGYSNKEIAYRLRIAETTVKTHIRHLLVKLNVQSRTQAVLIAIRMGLLSDTPAS